MQRDLGNEVIVAIAAVGILAFAITFAIILSLSNTPDANAALTATASASTGGGSPAAVTNTVVAGSSSEVPPTEDTGATFTAIAATIEAIQTSTGVPGGETEVVATSTNAEIATESSGSIPTEDSATTRSSTPEPSGASATPVSAQSNPTVTPTPRKSTSTSTFTATLTFTASPVPPTKTPSPTRTKSPTPVPTATRTPRPTETSGIRPTPTNFATLAVSAPPITCTPPRGWVIYVVGQGDTLFSIARLVGSSTAELQTANCLSDINNIYAGMPIYVPVLPMMPDNPNGTPGVPNGTLQPEGCTDPSSVISNIQPGQAISGVFNVKGTANLPDFWYYKLEVRPDFATVYNFYSRSETAVVDGSLGQIDQGIFGVGLHWIKLTVIGRTSGATPCAIPVIFQ